MKQKLLINDFNLFIEFVKSASRIVDSAKFQLNSNGVELYGARQRIARIELTSNAISTPDDKEIEFSILNLNMLAKVLNTVKDIHDGDYTDFNFIVDSPFIRFESKKFKTKLLTCGENVIESWVSKKVSTKLTPEVEFKTSIDYIKRINSHTFIFPDQASVRVYLQSRDDMENNSIFATIGNLETNLNNEITLKLGLTTIGKLSPDRKIILDIERLNLFSAIPSNDIVITLMKDINVLVSKSVLTGKNNSYLNLNIYNTLLKQ